MKLEDIGYERVYGETYMRQSTDGMVHPIVVKELEVVARFMTRKALVMVISPLTLIKDVQEHDKFIADYLATFGDGKEPEDEHGSGLVL